MSTVQEIVHRLFPNGTYHGHKDHKHFPIWPPDMFALTATLIKRTGCYAHAQFGGYGGAGLFTDRRLLDDLCKHARSWASIDLMPEGNGQSERPKKDATEVLEYIQDLWEELLTGCDQTVERYDADPAEKTLKWWQAAIKLLILADEASRGIGFPYRPVEGAEAVEVQPGFPDFVMENYRKQAKHETTRLPHPGQTLCWMVPNDELCVQPKATTCQVGCSLGSMTHHLALLPPFAQVKTHWFLNPRAFLNNHRAPPAAPLNILLAPFPYSVNGAAFVDGGYVVDGSQIYRTYGQARFFDVEQRWLTEFSSRDFASFLLGLIGFAHQEVDVVHAIVLPELALDFDIAQAVAKELGAHTKLEFFITGIAYPGEHGTINGIYTCLFSDRKILLEWTQPKHHRWKLDASQIRRYHLGNTLSPQYDWWEKIDIHDRACYFYVFRPGAVLTALVCEDLARTEPVQPVIRAIGPNLVIALLMDGPQLQTRWANRYATVLADDPGSAVLVLTSYGMVRRSVDPGEPEPNIIGLWKDPMANQTVELKLPAGHQALLLTLVSRRKTEYTLDGRPDEDGSVKLNLMGVRPLMVSTPVNYGRV